MADEHRFRIAPLTATTFRRFFDLFPILGVALPVPFLLIGLGVAGLSVPSLRMPWGVAALLLVAALMLPVFTFAAIIWSRRGFVEIDDTRLIVRGAPMGPSAFLDRLRLSEARAVNLRDERALCPASGGGLNLPGYCAGSGSLGRGERVAWLLTDPGRVVYIPAREGHSVLVSVQSPEDLVAALRSARVPLAQTGAAADRSRTAG